MKVLLPVCGMTQDATYLQAIAVNVIGPLDFDAYLVPLQEMLMVLNTTIIYYTIYYMLRHIVYHILYITDRPTRMSGDEVS